MLTFVGKNSKRVERLIIWQKGVSVQIRVFAKINRLIIYCRVFLQKGVCTKEN